MKSALVLAALLFLSGAALAEEPKEAKEGKGAEFTLINKTGHAIDKVYLTASGSHDWGSDELGSDQLPDDNSAKLSFADLAHCHQDLKAVYSDKSAHTWSGINLCEENKLVLEYDAANNSTSYKTE